MTTELPGEMHPLLLFEYFENWALGHRGTQYAFVYISGFIPIMAVSLVVCLIPSWIVLLRDEWKRRQVRRHE